MMSKQFVVVLALCVLCVFQPGVSAFRVNVGPHATDRGGDAVGSEWELTTEEKAKRHLFAMEGLSKAEAHVSRMSESVTQNSLTSYMVTKVDLETGRIYDEEKATLEMDFGAVDLSEHGYNYECLAANPITGKLYAISQDVLDRTNYTQWVHDNSLYPMVFNLVEIDPITKTTQLVGGWQGLGPGRQWVGTRGVADCTFTPQGELYFYMYRVLDIKPLDYTWSASDPVWAASGLPYNKGNYSPKSSRYFSGYYMPVNQGVAGIYRYDLEMSTLHAINNTLITDPYKWLLSLEYYPKLDNFMLHNGPSFIPLVDWNSLDSQAMHFVPNVYGDWTWSSSGPVYLYAMVSVSSSSSSRWMSYSKASWPGFYGLEYGQGTRSWELGNTLTHWNDDKFLTLATTWQNSAVMEAGCNFAHLASAQLSDSLETTLPSSICNWCPDKVRAENIKVQWAPNATRGCNTRAIAVMKVPDVDMTINGVEVITYFETTGSTFSLPVDTLRLSFTALDTHHAQQTIVDVTYAVPVNSSYNVTFTTDALIPDTNSISMMHLDAVDVAVQQGCLAGAVANMAYPYEVSVLLQFGDFEAAVNVGPVTDLECRCGYGTSMCLVEDGETVSCNANGTNVVCSTCQDGYAGSACDVDTEPPVLSCPRSITTENGTLAWEEPVVTDNSLDLGLDNVVVIGSHVNGGNDLIVGTNTIIYTADDGFNVATCSFVVLLQDYVAPVITCNSTVVEAPMGTNSVSLDLSALVDATDALAGLNNITYTVATYAVTNGSLFTLGGTDVVATAIDYAGLTSTCEFTVTVVDVEAPVLTCSDVSYTINNGTFDSSVLVLEAFSYSATDNDATFDALPSVAAAVEYAVGSNDVTLIAEDAAGNTAECSFKITLACQAGYTGSVCEEDIDDCASSPCDAAGTSSCFDLGANLFDCKCLAGYTGELCTSVLTYGVSYGVTIEIEDGVTAEDVLDAITTAVTADYLMKYEDDFSLVLTELNGEYVIELTFYGEDVPTISEIDNTLQITGLRYTIDQVDGVDYGSPANVLQPAAATVTVFAVAATALMC